MPSPNKKRFLQNAALILIILGLAFFLWFQKNSDESDTSHLGSTLYDQSIGDEASEILIHVEGRPDILLKNIDDVWTVVQPTEFIADEQKVRQLFTILSENADTRYDLEGKDLASYGLDKDRLSVSFNNVKLVFGQYNPVSQKRYILKADTLYLVSETVSGLLKSGVDVFRLTKSNDESSEVKK